MNKYTLLFCFLAVGLLMTGCEKEEEEDNAAPELSGVVGPDLVIAGASVTLEADASDADGDDVTLIINGTEGNTYTAPSSAGTVTLTIGATDGTDEAAETVSYSMVVVSLPAPVSHWGFNSEDGYDSYGVEDLMWGGETEIVSGGKLNKAIQFFDEDMVTTGTCYSINAPTSLGFDATTDYTIALWVKTADSTGYLWGLTNQGLHEPSGGEFDPLLGSSKGAYIGDGYLSFDNSWVDGFGTDTLFISDDDWHLIVTVHDGATDMYDLFIDDIHAVDGDWEFGTSLDPDEQVLTFGESQETPDYTWPFSLEGLIDNATYWDVAFTPAQVMALYNAHD